MGYFFQPCEYHTGKGVLVEVGLRIVKHAQHLPGSRRKYGSEV